MATEREIQADIDAGYGLVIEGIRASDRAEEGVLPRWPMTPEEREAIPDYGDLASTIIWYPVRKAGYRNQIICANCGERFEAHDERDGACSSF